MGLIGGILQPLYADFPVTLLSPVAFLQQPLRWLAAITRYQATTSGGPNFAYDLCVRKTSPQQRATLDLSRWRVAFNGAEPLRPETMERFAAAFAPSGFRYDAFLPCYGLAEAALIVSGKAHNAQPLIRTFQAAALEHHRVYATSSADASARRLVGCGPALDQQQLVIVQPETRTRCAPGQIGEVWLSGPSVAQGYWERPEETCRTFGARLADSDAGPFLRTGDLGFLQEGELFITGRLKDLLIIHGRNHYPQDIELTVEQCHAALRAGGGAAFTVEIDGQEQVVVVHEVERQQLNVAVEQVATVVRQAVAEQHELHIYALVLIKPGSLPKTSSGKIQRYACRAGFLDGSLAAVGSSLFAPDDASAEEQECTRASLLALPAAERAGHVEAYLQRQVARLLRTTPASIQLQEPLTGLGLDSLMAMELQHALETKLELIVPIAQLLQGESIAQLAPRILAQVGEAVPTVAMLPAAGQAAPATFPLSIGQRALWFLQQLAPESTAYHITYAVRLRAPVEVPALQHAFHALHDRHPLLRATFSAQGGAPLQHIHTPGARSFEVQDATDWSEQALQERLTTEAQRPFDLVSGPLLRLQLFRRAGQEYVLLLTMHHIMSDFWTAALLVGELAALYSAQIAAAPAPVSRPSSQYADYVGWQQALLDGDEGARLRSYWHAQLAGATSVLALPTDRPRPTHQTFHGAQHSFRLDAALTRAIRQLGERSGATLSMTLLAAFNLLLHRYTGQDDILVGSPTAGRSRGAFAGIVGYFVNPLVLRTDLAGNPSFSALLERVRGCVLSAFAHQDYPFPTLVEHLQPTRDPSRSPLFQVLFVLQQAPTSEMADLAAFAVGASGHSLTLGELRFEALALEQQTAQFDLTLSAAEVQGRLLFALHYNRDLFDATTIARMAIHYQTLLSGIVVAPQRPIAELPLLSAAELAQLELWNATATAAPKTQGLHELIDAQVRRSPQAPAVVFEGSSLTYQELDQRANQLARYLGRMGVGPETLVGVCLERSLELVVALLAILKAGGVYVPLDPAYPVARLRFMLADSQAAVLLTNKEIGDWGLEIVGAHQSPISNLQSPTVVCLDAEWEQIAHELAAPFGCPVSADHAAYMIYTSGSTGRPKGAVNTHAGICNRLLWMQQTYQLTAEDRVLQKTPFSFDVSVWEFFWPLISGARLVLARPGGHQDSDYLVKLINEQQITTLHFVPSMLQSFLEHPHIESCVSLRRVICSGEALPVQAQERFFERLDAELHNLYGPTEAAVDVTAWACVPGTAERTVPIGHPIANIQIHLLDRSFQPVPVGVAGELYIGGIGLARGYHGRPELTAERFIPNPFATTDDRRPTTGDGTDLDGGRWSVIGGRLYRTGDLARYRSDGAIEYLGRLDYQVKLRGFRVELGEIEFVLGRHPSVREAAVVAREDVAGDTRLVAYVVAGDWRLEIGDASGDNLQSPISNPQPALRAFLTQHLPEYMIPSAFVFLDQLPLAPNGKLDRRALPAPELTRSASEMEFVAPRTPVEQTLAEIWRDVLKIERLGIEDNFFTLGGHSLLITQVVARIREALQVELPMRSFFEKPTIAGLALTITQMRAAQRDTDKMQQMLERLGRMSQTDVTAMLASRTGSQTQRLPLELDTGTHQRAAEVAGPSANGAGGAGERYRRGDVERMVVGPGMELVYSKGTRSARILHSDAIALLERCQSFKTLDEHAGQSAGDAETAAAVKQQLAELRDAGFLVSYSETIAGFTQSATTADGNTPISTVAWPTANRVAVLERSLVSYIENRTQYGRTYDFAVLDDSPAAETRSAYRSMLRGLRNQHGVPLRYAGLEEKTAFAKRISDQGSIPLPIVQFALFGAPGAATYGANTNALLLHSVGDLAVSADDDIVCRMTPAPQATPGLRVITGSEPSGSRRMSVGYPEEVWCFPDREALLQATVFAEADPLRLHEQLLGKRVGNLLAIELNNGQRSHTPELDPVVVRQLQSSGGRVMVTLPGLIGDCAWGTPSNYLLFTGASFDRLVETEATYRAACTSRQILRVAQQATLARNVAAMTGACYGIDNRRLVPPALPLTSGQDVLFGLTVSRCFDDGYFAHLPWATLHLPVEERAFWPGEILRSATGIAFHMLLWTFINRFDFGFEQATGADRLRKLGRELEALGSLSSAGFDEAMRLQVGHEVSQYLLDLEEQLERRNAQPAFWAADVGKFTTLMRESLTRAEFYVPVDLRYGRDLSEARDMTQRFVRQFGQLLYWWPAMVEATRALRAQGHRLAILVEDETHA